MTSANSFLRQRLYELEADYALEADQIDVLHAIALETQSALRACFQRQCRLTRAIDRIKAELPADRGFGAVNRAA